MSDTVSMHQVFLVVTFCLAAPLNVYVLIKLCSLIRRHPQARRHLLLKLNVNISDLMVCFMFILPRVVWSYTHEFYGGPLLCKTVMFGLVFCFVLSSSALAAFGLDRLCTIVRPFSPQQQCLRRVRCLIGGAWVYSIVFAAPQLFTWNTVEIVGRGDDGNVTQEVHCATGAHIAFYYEQRGVEQSDAWLSSEQQALIQFVYQWVHVITTFALPFVIILICYFAIMCQVCQHLLCAQFEPPRNHSFNSITSSGTTNVPRTQFAASNVSRDRDREEKQPMQHGGPAQGCSSSSGLKPYNVGMAPIEETSLGPSVPTPPSKHQLQNPLNDQQQQQRASTCSQRFSVASNAAAARRNKTLSRQYTAGSMMSSTGATLQRLGTSTSLALNNLKQRRAHGGLKTSVKMMKTAWLLITAFIVCWLPYTAYMMKMMCWPPMQSSPEQAELYSQLDVWCKNWLVMNSLINPLLYGFHQPDLDDLKLRFGCLCRLCGGCFCCLCCFCCKLFAYEWDEDISEMF